MKKIFIFLNVIALGALVASCDLNKEPVFDDANAFVELGVASATVAEDGKTVSIPVTLASLNGVEELVTYKTVDGTAQAGVDFNLADPTATLSFDAENRTRNIVINIIERSGEYTGDLKFSVELVSAGSLAFGMSTSCTITITDNDHPLAAILGSYTCESLDYGGATQTWNTQILKDADDVTVVHISYLTPGCVQYASWESAKESWAVSGVVNEEKNKITVAGGQYLTMTYASETDLFQLYTWVDSGSNLNVSTSEDIVFTLNETTGAWETSSNIWMTSEGLGSFYTNWCVRGPMTMTKNN